MVENLQSWILDMSPPSPQVASLLNKATFLFLPTLVFGVLALEQRAAKPEFGHLEKVFLTLILTCLPVPFTY